MKTKEKTQVRGGAAQGSSPRDDHAAKDPHYPSRLFTILVEK
jgi:hypothetical protein